MSRGLRWVRSIIGALCQSKLCRQLTLGVSAICAVIVLCVFGIQCANWIYDTSKEKIMATLDMRIQHIEIDQIGSPNVTIDITETLEAHNLYIGARIDHVNWDKAMQDLEDNIFVADVHMRRPAKDKVVITFSANEAIARVGQKKWVYGPITPQDKDTLVLIDRQGQKIRVKPRETDKDLIVIAGVDISKSEEGSNDFNHVDAFWRLLMSEPDVAKMTSSVEFIQGRRWDITLRNKTSVKLPSQDAALALSRLAIIIREEKLDFSNIQTIDLRLIDRAFVEYKNLSEDSDGPA